MHTKKIKKNQETTFKGDSVKLIKMFQGCGYSPDNLMLEDMNSELESVGLALATWQLCNFKHLKIFFS